MIYCILMNPTIDQLIQIPGFAAGKTYQIENILEFPVGKAISVALTMQTLGTLVHVVALIGENELSYYQKFLHKKDIECTLFPVKGTTRKNQTIINSDQNISTHLRFPGFHTTKKDLARIEQFLIEKIQKDDYVIFSGSLPVGAPPEYFFKPSEIINQKGAKLIIDTSGERLKPMLLYNPFLIKANLEEMSMILDIQLSQDSELPQKPTIEDLYNLLDKCKELFTYKSRYNILTLGNYGALAFNREASYYAYLSLENTPYTIGCGDSFLAGFMTGIVRNLPFPEILKLAAACGAANTQKLGPGILDRDLVEKFISQVNIQRLK